MICPLCKNDTLCIDVSVVIRIPAEFEGRLTKRLLRSSESELLFAEWDRSALYCRTPGCGHRIRHMEEELNEDS